MNYIYLTISTLPYIINYFKKYYYNKYYYNEYIELIYSRTFGDYYEHEYIDYINKELYIVVSDLRVPQHKHILKNISPQIISLDHMDNDIISNIKPYNHKLHDIDPKVTWILKNYPNIKDNVTIILKNGFFGDIESRLKLLKKD
jgi:hypothetical protein